MNKTFLDFENALAAGDATTISDITLSEVERCVSEVEYQRLQSDVSPLPTNDSQVNKTRNRKLYFLCPKLSAAF